MGRLINRILDLCILISSLPGSASRMHVESLAMSTSVLEALPGKLDIKRHEPSILYIYTCRSGVRMTSQLQLTPETGELSAV